MEHHQSPSGKSDVDVLIAGGGLAGLTLARQLRRAHPNLSVMVVEKTKRPLPLGAHKVGESSVELGSQYLERLGLRDYLHENHLLKLGLRFFPGGGQRPIAERTEIGPSNEPVVVSYQIDRGRFENDLRGLIQADGVTLLEGVRVRELQLGADGAAHRVMVEREGALREIGTRWFVDASGRTGFLRKQLKLTRRSGHQANAGWFRVDGVVDITTFAPPEATAWHALEKASERWRSTNHLMGHGYWVWIIPLSGGRTSIGVVVHDEAHGFDEVRTLERVQEFIKRHEPVLAEALADHTPLDFGCLHGYSHGIGRAYSADRWAAVGDAAAFVDPLYSPGTDFIALANSFTEELIRVDQAGGDLRQRAQELNAMYRALVMGALEIYRTAAPVYNHPRALQAKVYWDNFAYWCFPCQFFLQEIYRVSGDDYMRFSQLGQRFVELSGYVQAMVGHWAQVAPEEPRPGFVDLPAFPSLLVDTHLALQSEMSVAQTYRYMKQRSVEGEEIVAELLLRLCLELGEDRAKTMIERLQVSRWDLRLAPERLALESAVTADRARTLPPISRDVERVLGRVPVNARPEALAELLAPLLSRAPREAARGEGAASAGPGDAGDAGDIAAPSKLKQLLAGKWVAAAIAAAAELGVADALADAPLDTASLAHRLGCDAPALERLMSVVAGEGLFAQLPDGRFQLLPLGEQLKSGALRDLARYAGSDFLWRPWACLGEAVRTGTAAFELTHGRDLFSYLDLHASAAELYQAAVEAFTRADMLALCDAFDFSRARHLVDVGGGRGAALIALLQRNPELRGTLLERPAIAGIARQQLEAAGLAGRADIISGDFFESIPAGADLYLVMHVLHNWRDEQAIRLLGRCAASLGPNGRVLVVEPILLPGPRRGTTRYLDLEMLALRGAARERSKPELRRLISRAGLKLQRTHALVDATRLLVCAASA